ncbi:type II secretion system protein, partial [bacterium]|nr:type II secretion system protein [bacterium]
MSKKTGFTFGEFLIAFVVIGIVAVLTIPLLLKFQHDKDIVSGLEGVRATLAQATKMAETHIGYIEEWDLESMNSTEAFERYYKPYLQIGINCTGSSNHNCWQPTHNFINGELADGGAKYGITGSPDVSFTISNGTNLTLTKVKNIDEKLGVEGNLSGYIVFMADVN